MAGAMTAGDAASLVDPFMEKVCALLSAKLTSKHFDKDLHSSGFTSELLKHMDELWAILGKELTTQNTSENDEVEEAYKLVHQKGESKERNWHDNVGNDCQ